MLIAVLFRHYECAEILLKAGADISMIDLASPIDKEKLDEFLSYVTKRQHFEAKAKIENYLEPKPDPSQRPTPVVSNPPQDRNAVLDPVSPTQEPGRLEKKKNQY